MSPCHSPPPCCDVCSKASLVPSPFHWPPFYSISLGRIKWQQAEGAEYKTITSCTITIITFAKCVTVNHPVFLVRYAVCVSLYITRCSLFVMLCVCHCKSPGVPCSLCCVCVTVYHRCSLLVKAVYVMSSARVNPLHIVTPMRLVCDEHDLTDSESDSTDSDNDQ